MSRAWTEQQKNAIESTGGTILVSAAAGSGKTSVLVERLIRMVTDSEKPVDVDRLLVVTFTRDAAAEMKQRISDALNSLLKKDPFNPQLLRQSRLIHTASISTIDSFCGDLVKEYFHTLGISPDYRIADEGELELMKEAAVSEAMESMYSEDREDFSRLLDVFSGKHGDKNLRETILKINGFLETQPFPEKWLDDMYESYGTRDVKKSIWGQIIIDYAVPAAAHAVNLTESSLKILLQGDEKLREKLTPVLEEDLIFLQGLQEKLLGESWDKAVSMVRAFAPSRMTAPRGYKDDPVKLAVAANRDNVKDTLKSLQKYFCRTSEEARLEFEELQNTVGVLFDLERRYIEALDELKRRKNVLTFADIELLAVKLLAEPDGCGGYIKTAQGNEISARYDAVIVDEFQDINDVQNLIFNCVSKDESNLFTVGDVKQCIYGFRQAKPLIFVNRKESYPRFDPENPSYPATIILDKNFRSRKEVCDTVNFIFSRLINKDTAQMNYSKEEYLNAGADYEPADGCETEFNLIDSSFVEEDNPEALFIARRIREIMSSDFLVSDGSNRRKPTYGDFAVMLRSTKSTAPGMVKTLIENGIPAYTEEKENAFDTLEVKVLLNLLRVIDNPSVDLPLLSVLCSPVYGFTPDELAQMRAKNRHTSLYSALKAFSKKNSKAADFLFQLGVLRSYAYVSTVDELIGRVLEATSLGAVTAAVNGGDAPMRNINLVRRYARKYESNGSKMLSDFVFYIDRLIENGVKLPSSASSDADNINGVRVLSIHKSKGLEYPFCFLAGTGKRFNKTDLHSDVLIDSFAGLGIKRKDGVCRYNTLPRLAVEIEINKNEIAEELRVLYVALTRAKEKLIIVGSMKNTERYIAKTASQLMFGKIIDPFTVTAASKPIDWLTLCALVNPSSRKSLLSAPEQIVLKEDYPLWKFNIISDISELISQKENNTAEKNPESVVSEINYAELLRKNLTFVYPNADKIYLPQKVSASQIAHSQSGDYFEKIITKPAFLSREDTSAVERGTAHHIFLQYCDFERAREDINAEIELLSQNGLLSEKQAESIDEKGLSKLLATKLFDRIIASPKLYREEQFTAKIPPSVIYDGYEGDDSAEIVMQGAVDLAFEENGKLVIVDYKTDRVRDINKLVRLYKKQLDLYRAAMEQSLEAEVKECIICSVALNNYIIL